MSTAPAQTCRRTPLFDEHRAAGARLIEFAGWEMPVQYAGVGAEHLAVRDSAGVFDVSHMGEIETTGPGARDLLQHVLSNDLDKLVVGGAQYSVLCAEDGGVIDDVFTYRLEADRYLTVTNAANHLTDFAWIAEQAGGFDVEVADRANDFAMIALQGPRARALVAALIEGEAPARMGCVQARVAGLPALVCGTGYTGEDGFELLINPVDGPAVWRALTGAGAVPAGLAARDTLRLEVCYHLYGNELSRERNPIEAGLAWCCALDTGFIGADALGPIAAGGPAERLVAFAFTGPGVPRGGNPVLHDGREVGAVTSGTMSPSMEIGIGMAYVESAVAAAGTPIEVDVRGRPRRAEIRDRPLFKPSAGP